MSVIQIFTPQTKVPSLLGRPNNLFNFTAEEASRHSIPLSDVLPHVLTGHRFDSHRSATMATHIEVEEIDFKPVIHNLYVAKHF